MLSQLTLFADYLPVPAESIGKEQRCLSLLDKLQIRQLKTQLALTSRTGDFCFSCQAIAFEQKLHTYWAGRKPVAIISWFLLVPVFLLLIVPFLFLLSWSEAFGQRLAIKRQIRKLEKSKTNYETNKDKRLIALWRHQQACEMKFSQAQQLALLSDWIAILYGKTILDELNLSNMLSEKQLSQIRNKSHLQEQGILWVLYQDPIDLLVRDLSCMLGDYG